MRNISLIAFSVLFSSALFAKKVKFSVDMDTITININGIHVAGDFQDEAGFGPDWADPATVQLQQELSDPSIYSLVVDIPAFRCYEFKFINGIFGYEAEFVPVESRVLHNFIDNRWVYIDSLSNDTQIVQPVIFGTNAPAGKHLLRFRVDMRNVPTVSPLGVHVEGTFQGWDMTKTYMHSFDGNIHDYITYVDTGLPAFQHEYKFINGEAAGGVESVPLACANGNSNRGVFISRDSILEAVCFASCSPCAGNAMNETEMAASITIFPNPSNGSFTLINPVDQSHIEVYNARGEKIFSKSIYSDREWLNLNAPAGIYFIRIESNGNILSEKLAIE